MEYYFNTFFSYEALSFMIYKDLIRIRNGICNTAKSLTKKRINQTKIAENVPQGDPSHVISSLHINYFNNIICYEFCMYYKLF